MSGRERVLTAGVEKVHKPKAAVDAELDKFILGILVVILLLLGVLLAISLRTQWAHYDEGIAVALTPPNINHSAALTYARASDAAGMKLTATCLGFLLIFTGAVYVLRHAKTDFRLSGSNPSLTANLQTSSPGLVLVTLGVLLVGLAVVTKSDIQYNNSASPTDTISASISTGAGSSSDPAAATATIKPEDAISLVSTQSTDGSI